MKYTRILVLAGMVAGASSTGVSATNGPTNFTWATRCIPGSLTTCAAVQVSYSGNTVSMSIWNMSWGASNNFILTQLGLVNNVNVVPAVSQVSGQTGFINGPHPWALFNNITPKHLTIDFLTSANSSGGQPVNNAYNGIVNTCNSAYTSGNYWVNSLGSACGVTPPVPGQAVSFNFSTTGLTGWNLTKSSLYWTIQDPGGTNYTCYSGALKAECDPATPEPVTLALMGTGLLGLALPAVRRRRRRHDLEL